MNEPTSSRAVFARDTATRLLRAVRGILGSEVGGRAKLLLALLLTMLLGINALNVLNSYVSRYFMTAIERREWNEFVQMAAVYILVFAALTCVAVMYRFVEERLALVWRDWLTRRLVGLYLADRTYHRLNAREDLGHPDQRIADDVRAFTTSTLSIALIFLNGTFTIVAFSGVLWSISHVLFFTAVGYAVVGSAIAILLGRPLVRLNYDQSDREADFRSGLIHVRENAESVALLHREPHIAGRLYRHVDAITSNLKRVIAVNRNLSFFTTGYDYLIQIIPALIVAPLFIRGETEFGTIPQSSMAFAHLLGAFSLVVKQFPQLSTYAVVVARLADLAGATEAVGEPRRGGIEVVRDDETLAFDRVTLVTPNDRRVLVQELSFELRRGGRVRIGTASELEALAVQRAIAGIADAGEGRIRRPPEPEVLVVPDRPYLPEGTLRELLVGRDPVPEDAILEVVRSLEFEPAVQRVGGLDVERDWDEVFSLDEQRLVTLSRILLVRPRFAVLTGVGESLGNERAARLLDALVARQTGCLVLGDAELDDALFDEVIDVAADGRWVKKERDALVPREAEREMEREAEREADRESVKEKS